MQWTDLVGMAPDDSKRNEKVGLLLVTEAHLEYNAGLVISIGSHGRPSPTASQSSAEVLAEELADYRSQLLAMARPPVNPTDCSQKKPCLPRLSEYLWKTPLTLSLYGPCTVVSCAEHFGRRQPYTPLRRPTLLRGCRFGGPRGPTQVPCLRRGKIALRGSPDGRVPPSNKVVYPCCHTWKVPVKPYPYQGNTCSRPVFLLIACVLSFFMLLGKPKMMLQRFSMTSRSLGGKRC